MYLFLFDRSMANDFNFIYSFNGFWCCCRYWSKKFKRLVAYSSIGHVGYALAGLAIGTNEGIRAQSFI